MPLTKIMIGLGLCGAISTNACATENDSCKVRVPPSQAGVIENHGNFFFVYPQKISSNYDGCQKMWDEKGNLWLLLRFEKGKLVRYEMTEALIGHAIHCSYENSTLTHGSAAECPEYDSAKSGLLTSSDKDKPHVPPERDPRQ